MYLSLYSGLKSWVLAQSTIPAAVAKLGTLMFEGFIPEEFFPTDIRKQLKSDIDRDGYSPVSEDLGIILINECYNRFGKMIR